MSIFNENAFVLYLGSDGTEGDKGGVGHRGDTGIKGQKGKTGDKGSTGETGKWRLGRHASHRVNHYCS